MIGAKKVTAPDGTTWRVGRRWLPEKPKLWRRGKREGNGGSDWDVPFLDAVDDVFAAALLILAAAVVLLLLTTVVFPIVVLTLELLIVVVLLLAGVMARLVLRRPWTIRARAADGRELSW